MPRRRKQRLPQQAFEATIDSFSPDGRGVAHLDGKAIFIDGALPDETVTFRYTKLSRKHDEGRVEEVLKPSADRVSAKCKHFDLCGGCSLQHLNAQAQIDYKQASMLDNLKHIGKVEPEQVFEPIRADVWGYRRKARLGVKFVHKKNKVLVGFREKRNSFLADIESCEVLYPQVGKHLTDLQELIGGMDAKKSIPQIEVAIGDQVIAMVFRHLEPLSESDLQKLIEYAKQQHIQLYLQPGGIDSIHCIYTDGSDLFYEHPEHQVKVSFGPNDFFQVNTAINRQMVSRAVELLDLKGDENVLDLFCGLGNFTLPLARRARSVTGVEGDAVMVSRAKETAIVNGISNTEYYTSNLMGETVGSATWMQQRYDRILLDPPRLGAKEVIEHFGSLGASKIVYISCHPGTLARDAGELVHQHGYRLSGAGVMDMFPHTSHVESIAVFEK